MIVVPKDTERIPGERKLPPPLGMAELLEALIPRVRALKPALVEYLSHRPTWPCIRCGNFAFQEPKVICWWCRSRRGVKA